MKADQSACRRRMRLMVSFTVLFVALLPSPINAHQILIFGDSWGEPMVDALTSVFEEAGHVGINIEATPFIGLAQRLSTEHDFIREELDQRPDVTIVHLSIGVADILCDPVFELNSCNVNWTADWEGTQAEEDMLTSIMADVEAITDYIQSLRPDIAILWSSADYLRPRLEFGTPPELNAVFDKWANRAEQLAKRKPGLHFVNLHGLLQLSYGFDGNQYSQWDPPYGIPPGDPSLPNPDFPSPRPAFFRNNPSHLTPEGYKVIARGQYEKFYKSELNNQNFVISPGLNDAWYNPATLGQGFVITVLPEIRQMFLAWFTYDTERPPEDVDAILGEPGHRWLTAQGPYDGDTASLTIYVTEGGVFDAAEPPANNDGIGDGTMTIEFANCSEGLVTYNMTSPSVSGEIPIQRIVNDNVALCEALSSQ